MSRVGQICPLLAILLLSCGGESSPIGIAEPLRVRAGSFKNGPLPGALPEPNVSGQGPLVTFLESVNNVIRPGQSGKSLNGRTSADGVSVGLRFSDLGTGYWVIPTDSPDPQANGEFTFDARCDFGFNIPAGLHLLRVVAFNAHGVPGTQRELKVCVPSATPDNLNACDPNIPPPQAVLSLSWDNDADLDLQVLTPEGKLVDGKHPSTARSADGGAVAVDPKAPGIGIQDRDSNANCVADGVRRENIVWQTPPVQGVYRVYANLFSACGADVARFRLTLFRPILNPDGKTSHLADVFHRDGVLLRDAANGGSQVGLFVTEIPSLSPGAPGER